MFIFSPQSRSVVVVVLVVVSVRCRLRYQILHKVLELKTNLAQSRHRPEEWKMPMYGLVI